jgi:hypothetical protein
MNPLSTQLQERIAEIAKENAPKYVSGYGCYDLLVAFATQLATDPVLREELERPLREQLEREKTSRAIASNNCDQALAVMNSALEERDKLRERITELEAERDAMEKLAESHVPSMVALHSELLALQAQVAKMTDALVMCKDALDYGYVGDDRPHNRLIALIESERSTVTGDNWDYWNYLSEKLQSCSEPLTRALSSSPDLGLRDRVVEVISEFLNNSYPTNYEGGAWYKKARMLLSDLGATNPEQPK